MLVAFTLTPTLAALLLRGRAAGPGAPFAGGRPASFDRGLAASIRGHAARGRRPACSPWRPSPSCPRSGTAPCCRTLQDRNLLLQVAAAPGTSLPEMDRITAAASTRAAGAARRQERRHARRPGRQL